MTSPGLGPPTLTGILISIGLSVAVALGVWVIAYALAKSGRGRPPSLTGLLMLLGIMGVVTFLWVFVLWLFL